VIERLGKAEGFAAIGLFMLATLVGLLCFGFLSGDQFVAGFGILVGSYFGGGALAALRDFGKPKA